MKKVTFIPEEKIHHNKIMNNQDALKHLINACQIYLTELNEHVEKIVKIHQGKTDPESLYADLKEINYFKIEEASKVCLSEIKILFHQVFKENPSSTLISEIEIKE